MRQPRLVYVVTHAVTADLLLRGQLKFMREAGFEVTLIASPGPELTRVGAREGVRTIPLPMTRAVSPGEDLVATARMTALLRGLAPDIVNASTPKAGLVGMLAARAARVPIRVYLLRGLRLETTEGLLRAVLGTTERIASACADDVPCVSHSLRRTAVEGGHVPAEKARVIGAGSSNGVDLARFEPTPSRVEGGRDMLHSLGIEHDARTIVFVGRFVRDKGVAELIEAFRLIREEHPDAHLLLVGADLGGETVDRALAARARATPGVVLTGTMKDLAPIYAAADVLAFPSHREGFPNVVLEAACAGVPTVGFRVTGTADGVVDGETGTLVPRGDVAGLARALGRYLDDAPLRERHGAAARRRVKEHFAAEQVWKAWLLLYQEHLSRAGLPAPRPTPG